MAYNIAAGIAAIHICFIRIRVRAQKYLRMETAGRDTIL